MYLHYDRCAFKTQLNMIKLFCEKSRQLFSQKDFIVDARLGSEYASQRPSLKKVEKIERAFLIFNIKVTPAATHNYEL